MKTVLTPKKAVKKTKATELQPKFTEEVANLVTPKEEEALKNVDREVDDLASAELMDKVLELVSATFRVNDGYTVTAFADQGGKCSITLNNTDFEVVVKCKNLFNLGLREL